MDSICRNNLDMVLYMINPRGRSSRLLVVQVLDHAHIYVFTFYVYVAMALSRLWNGVSMTTLLNVIILFVLSVLVLT